MRGPGLCGLVVLVGGREGKTAGKEERRDVDTGRKVSKLARI